MDFAKRTVVMLMMLFFVVQGLSGQERAIDHAPIGVMGDHYHGTVSYIHLTLPTICSV